MRQITLEERQHFWNTLNQNLSYEGSLFTIISVVDQLKTSDIDPASLDNELINKIRDGLGYLSNIFLTEAQNIYKTGLLNSIPSSMSMVSAWYTQSLGALSIFDAWLKTTQSQNNFSIAPSIYDGHNQSNCDHTSHKKISYSNAEQSDVTASPQEISHSYKHHDIQPQHKPSNTLKIIPKTKLSNILHGNEGHAGYHTKSWFYYFFGYLLGLSNKRSGTIVMLFALLDQNKESFEEQDIKNAIKSFRNYDTHALRRLSLFEGTGNKNGSSTDDIIEELKTAFLL